MRLPFNGNYPITQKFGVNPASYAQFGMKGHNGIDYGLPTGTPVVAAEDGVIATLQDPPGFGLYVQITGQYKTVYAHLSKFAGPSGSPVKAGQLIGYSGNTGNSSGPHLHFGVKPLNPDNNNGYFGAIDPQPLLTGDTNVDYKKAYEDATAVATIREDYLNKIGFAEGSAIGAIEGDDVARIIAGIDRRNRRIQDLERELAAAGGDTTVLAPGNYTVK